VDKFGLKYKLLVKFWPAFM